MLILISYVLICWFSWFYSHYCFLLMLHSQLQSLGFCYLPFPVFHLSCLVTLLSVLHVHFSLSAMSPYLSVSLRALFVFPVLLWRSYVLRSVFSVSLPPRLVMSDQSSCVSLLFPIPPLPPVIFKPCVVVVFYCSCCIITLCAPCTFIGFL